MPRNHVGANIDRSEFYGVLQRMVDALFQDLEGEDATVRRLDVVLAAETYDLPDELMRLVGLLPPGDYTRLRLCDQLNSAITGHAWGQVYGTVS
ncbi:MULTISPECIES: hypothetical protein [unclassified Adlercreutzia]|uniref:hypothetical protein n=1 Tax=unclassified Adlercreutzia TaxID=2636013 RepID=UPI0013EDF0CA|nr:MULTISPECIES: hypothetical protein [unclassified Adlercreutzia]